jgi:four helix bundle protein
MTIRCVEDLEVYRRSYRLALEMHLETLKFPAPDKLELGGQIRRASKSIPANIAEGFASRKSTRQYARYLGIARESCDEIFTHLKFARDLGYFSEEKYEYFFREYKIVVKQLSNLYKKWSRL